MRSGSLFIAENPAEALGLALDSGAILGVWEWDIPRERFTGDAGCAHALGLDLSIGDGWVPLDSVRRAVHPQDWPPIEHVAGQVMRAGGRYSVEYRALNADGDYRWIQSNGVCHLDAHGQPGRFAGVLIDIDARKRTEERLRQSEAAAREANALLHAVIESVPALIYVKDRQGRMQVANAATLALIGKPWAAVRYRTDAEFLDNPHEAAAVMATDRRVMETEGSEQIEEVVSRGPAEPRIWLSNKSVMRDEAGAVIGLVGTSIDITERKRAEQALAASEARLRRVLDNLFVFVGIMDLDGNLLEANRAPVEGAGLAYDQVLGRPVWDLYWWSHDPDVRDRIREATEKGRAGLSSRFDVEIRWRDDSRITIDFQMAPLRDDHGRVVELIPSAVDISSRKRAEAERETLILELNHRVKNLFMVACGMVNMAARRARTPAEMAEALTGRLMALSRAHALIMPAVVGVAQDQGASLRDLVAAIVEPHIPAELDPLRMTGREVQVAARETTGLALILHELATNSAKYGALSVREGRLDVAWQDAAEDLLLSWAETGGPPVAPPAHDGFGGRLLRSTAAGLGGGIEFAWQPAGLRVTLRMRRDRIEG